MENNVQIDGIGPTSEIMHGFFVISPLSLFEVMLGKQVFLIACLCLDDPPPPSFSDDGSNMIFHG